ncbi:hypothetical protein GCM10027261_24340 [Geodermatophilus arenarius]|uniref:Fibronectin type-III domain-containing protein n=1 Tax=Geodermatophilus arenarius TaxID=1137990 RepID=A0ABV9LIW8_9ACTN
MASALYSELRTARDQHGVAPDASDGVLLLIARSRVGDPDQLAGLLRDKGITLAPSSVQELARLVRESGGGTPAPPPAAAPASGGAMGFLTRVDDQPAGRVVDSIPPVPAAPPQASSRRDRGGLSPEHAASRIAAGTLPPPAYPAPAAGPAAAPEPAPAPQRPAAAAPPPPAPVPALAPEPEPEPAPVAEEPGLPGPEAFSDDVDQWATRGDKVSTRRVDDRTVDISWPALDASGQSVVYLLVASSTGIPPRPSAGTRVLVTDEPRASVPAGTGPFVSVFSYTADTAWSLPTVQAVHHAAGRVVPEVADLHVSVHNDAVVLSWTAPRGVSRVRVLRSLPDEALPPTFDAAREIGSTPAYARDTGVLPGRRYEYRVLTQFTEGSVTHLSTGIEAVATIPAVPQPVTDLTATVSGETAVARVELRWTTPELGTVVVYETGDKPEHAATGRVISRGQLDVLPLGRPVGEPVLSEGPVSMVPGIPFRQAEGARRAYTPVTLIGDQAAVGPAAVVDLLGAPRDVALTERVGWQLLRFAWPVGATFVEVERGGIGGPPDGTPAVRISEQEYRRLGGMRLENLPVNGCDLHLRGSVRSGGVWTHGPTTVVTYPGRWVLYYRIDKVGRIGRRRQLSLYVERPWQDAARVAFVTRQDRMPLNPWDLERPPDHTIDVRGNTLVPHQWTPVGELPPEGPGYTRLFAQHERAGWPAVVPPPSVPRPPGPAPAPLAPGQLRCVTCGTTQDAQPTLFRCTGTCQPAVDPVLSGFLGEATEDRPLFAASAPGMDSVACPRCSTPSREVVCKACHSPLQSQAAATDPVTVTVVGARGTGKTTFLVRLCDWVEKVWGPATGAPATPLDSHTVGRLQAMRESLTDGRALPSTMTVEQNPDLLTPMLMTLDQWGGRARTLALYDVAGEDTERPGALAPYGPTMARSDALLFLLDPLQIEDVRNFLEGQIPLPPVAGNPLTVLNNVITEIRRRAQETGPLRMPLMVAVSKLDGIHEAVGTPGTDLSELLNGGSALMHDPTSGDSLAFDPYDRYQVHEETRSLLLRLNAMQFLSLAEGSFSRVEYFSLSALGHSPAGATLSEAGVSSFRVPDPLRWLVAGRWPGR